MQTPLVDSICGATTGMKSSTDVLGGCCTISHKLAESFTEHHLANRQAYTRSHLSNACHFLQHRRRGSDRWR
jgi:hypothetical protein